MFGPQLRSRPHGLVRDPNDSVHPRRGAIPTTGRLPLYLHHPAQVGLPRPPGRGWHAVSIFPEQTPVGRCMAEREHNMSNATSAHDERHSRHGHTAAPRPRLAAALPALLFLLGCPTSDDDSSSTTHRCGDGSCNGSETCSTCSTDCGSCSSCDYDCMVSPGCSQGVQRCSDQICTPRSTCCSVADTRCECPGGSSYPGCGSSPRCGDGSCNGSETCSTCASDCGSCSSCSYDCMVSPGCSEGVQRCSDQICTPRSTCCSTAPTRCDCPGGSSYPGCGTCTPDTCAGHYECASPISDGCGGTINCYCASDRYCCPDGTGCCTFDTTCDDATDTCV